MQRRAHIRITSGALALSALLTGIAAIAAPVKYEIDPSHTYPSFEADHMGGLSVWRGKFNTTHGTVMLDKAAQSGSVDVSVDMASADFGLDKLNEVAQGKELFEVAKYPQATFRGKLVDFRNGAPTRLDGVLTLHGATQPLVFEIDSFKCMPHPMLKREVCGADATATFKRDSFGLAAGKDYGFRMDVALRIQVEAIEAAK